MDGVGQVGFWEWGGKSASREKTVFAKPPEYNGTEQLWGRGAPSNQAAPTSDIGKPQSRIQALILAQGAEAGCSALTSAHRLAFSSAGWQLRTHIQVLEHLPDFI